MIGNKQAYQAAYDRALLGKSSRGIWDIIQAPFEDTYTRQSREQGERDGAAARARASEMSQTAEGTAQHG